MRSRKRRREPKADDDTRWEATSGGGGHQPERRDAALAEIASKHPGARGVSEAARDEIGRPFVKGHRAASAEVTALSTQNALPCVDLRSELSASHEASVPGRDHVGFSEAARLRSGRRSADA